MAPIGNKNAVGNTGGLMPKYANVDQFNEAVDAYFEYIKGEFEWITGLDENGNPADEKKWIREPEPPTITGLCLYLGFESRQSFHDYSKKSDFAYSVKRARFRIENSYEIALNLSKQPTAQIFALKNLGWSDRTEIDNTSSDGSMTPKSTKIVFTNGLKDKS